MKVKESNARRVEVCPLIPGGVYARQKWHRSAATVPYTRKAWRLGTSGDDANALVDFVNSAIDVAESALLEALGEGVVFFVGDILVGFFEELLGAVEAAV